MKRTALPPGAKRNLEALRSRHARAMAQRAEEIFVCFFLDPGGGLGSVETGGRMLDENRPKLINRHNFPQNKDLRKGLAYLCGVF